MLNTLTIDPRQVVRWAYALLLDREPESEEVVTRKLQNGGTDLGVLRREIMRSEEFRNLLQKAGVSLPPDGPVVGPLDGMLVAAQQASPGFFIDRFGVRTRVEYFPPVYHSYSGQVGNPDGSNDIPLHEVGELNGLLRSVAEARNQFAVMELGAGWGPWIVLGGHLARRRGLDPVVLKGVEGSVEHVAFMRTHLADNGFDAGAEQVVHAVAGTYDGVAYFPKLADPSGNWGAEAQFESDAASVMEEVRCISLPTLLDGMPVVDFLHCDVQGAEADVIAAGMQALDERVRRICIGTHGRSIEAKLLDLLAECGWVLEFEQSCTMQQHGNQVLLIRDGTQVWQNPRLRA